MLVVLQKVGKMMSTVICASCESFNIALLLKAAYQMKPKYSYVRMYVSDIKNFDTCI